MVDDTTRILEEGEAVTCLPNGRAGHVVERHPFRTHNGIDYFVKYDEPVGDAHYSWFRRDELEPRGGQDDDQEEGEVQAMPCVET